MSFSMCIWGKVAVHEYKVSINSLCGSGDEEVGGRQHDVEQLDSLGVETVYI